MANITQVTVTSGVPTAGTGTVSTLDNLIGTAGAGSAQVLTVQGSATGTGIPVTIASLPSGAVTNAGTFAVQAAATLNAETTKVIGTVNVSAGQTIATTNAGTFAVQAAATLNAETTKVIGVTRAADGSGNLLTSTSNALDINIKSGVNSNGQAVMLNSAPVVIASNQSAVPVTGTASNNADAVATISVAEQAITFPMGWNGTTYDRFQVDASKNLKVTFGASAAGAAKIEGNTYATGDGGIPSMYVRSTAVPANQSGSDSQYEMGRIKNGRIYVRGEPVFFSAAFTTLTRPANTTAYLANQSISDNATAGSVTALSASPSDTNDDPICITEILVDTTDTGLAAGVQVRAWLYNSDPTANTGVGGGNGATFSNKRAGFIGSCSGTFRAFSDGGKARLVPDEGSYIVSTPTSGNKTIFIQYQTLGGFTPSAVSTTLIGTVRGFQGRV